MFAMALKWATREYCGTAHRALLQKYSLIRTWLSNASNTSAILQRKFAEYVLFTKPFFSRSTKESGRLKRQKTKKKRINK
jgi:hypothetical protein